MSMGVRSFLNFIRSGLKRKAEVKIIVPITATSLYFIIPDNWLIHRDFLRLRLTQLRSYTCSRNLNSKERLLKPEQRKANSLYMILNIFLLCAPISPEELCQVNGDGKWLLKSWLLTVNLNPLSSIPVDPGNVPVLCLNPIQHLVIVVESYTIWPFDVLS